jgi:hypothetical protein
VQHKLLGLLGVLRVLGLFEYVDGEGLRSRCGGFQPNPLDRFVSSLSDPTVREALVQAARAAKGG